MPANLFKGLFDTEFQSVIEVSDFLLCIGISLAVGIFLAFIYTVKTRYTKSFIMTLAMLPAVVCAVIMMVNGNIGAGVAVAGAFSLVRFRSAPGSAKEICMIFLAMGAGLICGMGYLAYAVLFSVVLGAVFVLFNLIGSCKKSVNKHKILKITIPEDLNYEGVFDEILKNYTSHYEMIAVKSVNMGSMFKIKYNITMKKKGTEKSMLDEIRCRNGNLEVGLMIQGGEGNEL